MKAGSWLRAGCAAVAVGVLGGGAQAATITQLIDGFGKVFISDEDGEVIIDRNRNGLLDIGDSIRGALTFDQFRKENGPQIPLLHQVGNSEFGGVFQIQITNKVVGALPGQFFFTFGPDAAFASEFGAAAGTAVIMWEDPGLTHFNIHEAGTQAASIASVSDGPLFWTLGFAEQTNAWFGKGSDNPALLTSPSTRLGESWFAISRTSAAGLGGSLLLADLSNIAGTGEFIGSSQIGGGFQGSPWPLSSESDAEFEVIPAPPAVLGGLMLMGALLRRRSRA